MVVYFLNTDNGQRVVANGPWIERYDRACNMQRIESEEPRQEVIDLTKLTVAELRDFAAKNDIDLGEATKKADLIAAIAAAPVEPIADPLGGSIADDEE